MTEQTDEVDAVGRAAQDAAGALSRMGIDPGALGLAAPAPPQPVVGLPATVREPVGGLAVPPPDRTAPRPTGRIVGRAAPMPEGSGALRFASPGTNLRRPLAGAAPTVPPLPTGPDPQALRAVAGAQRQPWAGFSGLRQVAHGVGKGVASPSSAGAVQNERELIARVRTRQREPRVTCFFSTVGGSGTTTTAAGVALALATVRGDPAALVDVQAGTRSLAARLAGTSSVTTSDVIRAGAMGALPQPPATIGSLAIVDSAPWYSPAERGDLVEMLHQVRSMYPFTVLDVGDEVSGTAHAMLMRADRLVIVQPAQPDLVDAVQYAMGRINQVDPDRLRHVVVAVVAMTPRSYRSAVRRLGALLGQSHRVVLVPYDRALHGGGPLSLATLRPSTREAYLSLAAFAAERMDL
jgi:MinD-like ATPase involved in chromosome partitioning or flagellar assembly